MEKQEYYFLRHSVLLVILPLWFFVLHVSGTSGVFFLDEGKFMPEAPGFVKKLKEVYPVLVEHNTYWEWIENQIPVFSSRTSGGRGGITEGTGFHTLTNSDTFQIAIGEIQKSVSVLEKKTREAHKTEEAFFRNEERKEQVQRNSGEETKNRLYTSIPANYRFRNDFVLRWDSNPEFAIASIELKGYKYFRNMLRQIQNNFSPPGLNLVWRDNVGTVISQPIKPQVVKVVFLLDENGTVTEARVVSSMGQKPVDEACIRALLNQNFGPPPPEIFEHGNIFGINFVFPEIQ